MNLTGYLDDLESRIDPAVEDGIHRQWIEFAEQRCPTDRFDPQRTPVPPGKLQFPELSVNAALRDSSFETMLLRELALVDWMITSNVNIIPMIRANYGSTILPSILGCELFYMDEELNTLPAAHALDGGVEAVKRRLARPVDPYAGQGRTVLECAAFFREQLAPYPKLSRLVKLYHPDYQGVLDIAEVLVGSEIFLLFYDDPALIRDILTFVCDAYIMVLEEYWKVVPANPDFNYHYGWLHRGKIRLSLDSCVNFSAELYEEFILEHDRRLLNRYGGVIHSCGKVDHFVESLNRIGAGYHGFNLSQPHLNDMERIFHATVDRGINLYQLLDSGVNPERRYHGLLHVIHT